MEIVNKFLNRDSENQKLKHLAAEAERKLDVRAQGTVRASDQEIPAAL